jgi:hypothetical protein
MAQFLEFVFMLVESFLDMYFQSQIALSTFVIKGNKSLNSDINL